MSEFWEDVGVVVVMLLAAFCVGGVVLGLIYSAEARIALAFWLVVVGVAVLLVKLSRWVDR